MEGPNDFEQDTKPRRDRKGFLQIFWYGPRFPTRRPIEGETKYMLVFCRGSRRPEPQVEVKNFKFDEVRDFIYLDSAIISNDYVSF